VPVSLRSRVIEVIADLGEGATPRYRYGSGCVVRGRSVLTAGHVVSGALTVRVRRPDKKLMGAVLNPRFIGAQPGPDLALVEIDDYRIDTEPIEVAVIDRDSLNAEPVRDCHAIGYPWFAEKPSPTAVRDTVDAVGYVPVLSGLAHGLLTVQVTEAPRPLPAAGKRLGQSPWSGMSGAPVVASGCLIGVVIEHAPRAGPSAITAVPLTALEPNAAEPGWGPGVPNAAEWWLRLGVTDRAGVRQLPDGASPAGGTGSPLELTAAERGQVLAALAEVFTTRSRIDGVLDDLGVSPGRRPLAAGTTEEAWRFVFHELDSGAVEDGYRRLLEQAIRRYPHNPTFRALAVRYRISG
jgi:Effector-associated domain 1/Trypsin-like peptidase domain